MNQLFGVVNNVNKASEISCSGIIPKILLQIEWQNYKSVFKKSPPRESDFNTIFAFDHIFLSIVTVVTITLSFSTIFHCKADGLHNNLRCCEF